MWNDALALNRLTRLIVMAVLVYAAFVALRWAANHPVFALRVIAVQGVTVPAAGGVSGTAGRSGVASAAALSHVQAAQVAQFCVPRITGTFFTNDLEATRAAFEALPWVRRATVRRQWPAQLVVSIEEHRALARWNDEDGNRFVNLSGEAFNAAGEKAIGATLPLLLGPEGSEKEVAQRYSEFARRLATVGHLPAVVALSPRQAWTIRLGRSPQAGRGDAADPSVSALAGAGPDPASVSATPSPASASTSTPASASAVNALANAHEGLLLDLGREQARAPVLARLDRFVAHYAATLGRIGARVEAVDLRYPNGFAARIPGFQGARAAAPKPPAPKPVRKPAVPKSARPSA